MTRGGGLRVRWQVDRRLGLVRIGLASLRHRGIGPTWKAVRRHLALRPAAQQDGPARPPVPPRLLLDAFLANPSARLQFSDVGTPRVTVILLTYGNAELSFECLQALAATKDVAYELVIVDNASTDRTSALLDRLVGAVIERNTKNVGFAEGCNQGARRARAPSLLFINNDAIVLPGTLQAMVAAEDATPKVGAVGCRVLLADGKLQEAGSIVWRDGSAFGYGRGEDPWSGEFGFPREVDYCSAVCLLVRTEAFRECQGFSLEYSPAYYEDADLGFRLRAAGWSNWYEPTATVIHHESSSLPKTRTLELMRTNHVRFAARWSLALPTQATYPDAMGGRDRDHSPWVLAVDDRIPDDALGSGFPRTTALLAAMRRLGFRVTLLALQDGRDAPVARRRLEALGVEVLGGVRDLATEILCRKGHLRAVWVSRPHNMRAAEPVLRRIAPGLPIIYDAEALFHRREELAGAPAARVAAMRSEEFNLASRADGIIAVTPEERQALVNGTGLDGRRVHVWGHCVEARRAAPGVAGRRGVLFVGAFPVPDSPNELALRWFVEHVLPALRDQGIPVRVAGADPPSFLRQPGVECLGFVANLEPIYDGARVFVVPHQLAAGIPIKMVEAMAAGLPVVVSPLCARQAGVQDGREALVGADGAEFARHIIQLCHDDARWAGVRDAAWRHVESTYASRVLDASLRACLDQVVTPARHR